MNSLINLYTSATGIWKKVSALLPLIIGAGTLLTGLGGFLLEIGHSANASTVINILRNIQNDPNIALVLAGIGALSIHTNHSGTVAAVKAHDEIIQPPKGP